LQLLRRFTELSVDNDRGLLRNLTGWRQVFNVADPGDQGLPSYSYERYPAFVNQTWFREAIHVGNTSFGDGSDVAANLALDMPQSVLPKLELLLDNGYKVWNVADVVILYVSVLLRV
jgi:hypothetical protein